MKQQFLYASAAILGLASGPAAAQTIQGAYVGCVTETALDEFVAAAAANDLQQIQALNGTLCISIEGLQFSVVDRGWSKSQVRVYGNGQSALLWTVSKAVK
ncbi:hypothetical protein [uncultured Roseovarius sp.]|uniref:hypothetical protein n=1 Tax=uncultured Roseovarius sp. TaxID=293344 RepID=UPI0026189B4D|nr:hypothetical protein [uncultured Roseovarius sp.]